jgi:hypothetical protein
LTRHWEAKCWRLHLESHPKNRTSKKKSWRVKSKGKEELLELASQGEMIFERPIATTNVIHSYEKDNKFMPKESPTHLLSSILPWRHPFFDIFQSLLVDRIIILK